MYKGPLQVRIKNKAADDVASFLNVRSIYDAQQKMVELRHLVLIAKRIASDEAISALVSDACINSPEMYDRAGSDEAYAAHVEENKNQGPVYWKQYKAFSDAEDLLRAAVNLLGEAI